MSKVHKVLGKLKHKIAQAEQLAAASRKANAQAQFALKVNDTLNATVVEQNERLELLGKNCTHYRERIADLNDKVSELEERNGELYSQLKTTASVMKGHTKELDAVHREYRDNLFQDRATSDAKLKECQSYLRQSRINTVVVTLALVATGAWPYVSPYLVKLFG